MEALLCKTQTDQRVQGQIEPVRCITLLLQSIHTLFNNEDILAFAEPFASTLPAGAA